MDRVKNIEIRRFITSLFARSRKGQTYMVEIVFVVLLASILAFILVSLFSTLVDEEIKGNKPYLTIWGASDVLIHSTGFSPDWEETGNLSAIGIVYEKNVLADPKLAVLASLSPEDISRLLHLEIYNVSIELIQYGIVYSQFGSIGSSTNIQQVERTCVSSNGTPILLRIRVGDNE